MRTAALVVPVQRVLVAVGVCLTLASPAYGQSESVEYYATDAVGSVRVVFNATGNIVGRMDYAPFGGELFGGTNLPDQRFAGLFRDGEAGLDYAQARSYQVRTGRFTAQDPVYAGMFDPQGWNRYSYAGNSPFSFTDATGLEWQSVNCGLGSYWCPGGVEVRKPDDIEKYFDPRQYGYQGGEEMARGEAEYAQRVMSSWVESVAAAFERESGTGTGDPKPSVTTDITEMRLPNGTKISPDGTSQSPFAQIAQDISHRAGALANPSTYGQLYLLAIEGGLIVVPGAGAAAADLMFARGGEGLLNGRFTGDLLRLGYGWEGKWDTGRSILRLAIRSKRGPMHVHIRIWPPPFF